MTTLHITHGEPLAAALREALRETGRSDRVIALGDDLTVGPLRGIDETAEPQAHPRCGFWQRVGGLPATLPRADAAALGLLEQGAAHVVIWHTHEAADQLTLRRVCYRLRNVPQRLNEVRLAPDDVTGDVPSRLAARLPDAAPISVLRITRLALEWQEAKQANGETRRWHDNTFTSGTFAELDQLILDAVNAAPTPGLSGDAILAALPSAGAGFTVGEPVLRWRLRELAAAHELRLRDDLYAAPRSAGTHRPAAPRVSLPLSPPR